MKINPDHHPASDSVERPSQDPAVPLLFGKRENLSLSPDLGKTTSCQKTSDPPDYGPDD